MKELGNKQNEQVLEGLAAAASLQAAVVDIDDVRPMRWGLWILALGFGGFLLWAGLAPLDAGVSSQGTVVVASTRKTIQHLNGGTVERILVEEGTHVKRGDLLIQLNSTDARAQLGVAEAQSISAKAVESRLIAERDGRNKVTYTPALAAYGNDPRVQQAESLQNQLFTTRRANLKSQVGVLNEQAAGFEEQLKGYEALKASRQSQAKWMRQELQGIRDLAQDGYVPKNKLFQLERSADDLDGTLADTVANTGRVRNAISETKMKILAQKEDYQKEVESQLTDIQKESQALDDRLKSLRYAVDSMEIRSPINGIVMGLNIHTVGGVIQPGFHIMDVVPLDDPLIVEAQVSPELIGKVALGLPVDINFPALDRHTTPTIPGKVLTVSADRLVEQRTGMPYYLTQVKVTPEGMKLIGEQQIKAGMPATVVVKTGERTMLNYLFKPLLDRMHAAFKED